MTDFIAIGGLLVGWFAAVTELLSWTPSTLRVKRRRYILLVVFIALTFGGLFWKLPDIIPVVGACPPAVATTPLTEKDSTSIRQLVEDASMVELRAYQNPEHFQIDLLKDYFVPSTDGGRAAEKIKNSIKRLRTKQLKYGPDARCEHFEVINIQFYASEVAEVITKEIWFFPYHNAHGLLRNQRNPRMGWQPTYLVRKINGKWLIHDTTVPYKKQKKAAQMAAKPSAPPPPPDPEEEETN